MLINRNKLRVELVYWFDPRPWSYLSERARLARLWGSDALRLQLREAMVPHLPETVELTFSGLCLRGPLRALHFRSWLRTRKPAVFLLLKHVAYHISPDELAQLRKIALAVGVDHKDAEASRLDLTRYDFHVSASETGRRALEAMLDEDVPAGARRPRVELLPQGPDRRLETVRPRPLDRLAAVYLGSPSHAAFPAPLRDEITILPVKRSADMDRMMPRLGGYNFHYAVRPDPAPALRRAYQPFTKGAVAAACEANILVNRQVDDAVDFLTTDYPYLVDSNAPADVTEGFRKAQEEFGGPEWRRGLEIMRDMRERLSGPALARQFVDLATRVAEAAAGAPAPGRVDIGGRTDAGGRPDAVDRLAPGLPEIRVAPGGASVAP